MSRSKGIAFYGRTDDSSWQELGSITSAPIADDASIVDLAFDAEGRLFEAEVTPNGGSRVVVFPAGQFGDVEPEAILEGPHTALNDEIAAITVAPDGTLYVAMRHSSEALLFDDFDGDVAPSGTLDLEYATALAVDEQGNLYASVALGAEVDVYAAGAEGTESPVRSIGPGTESGLVNGFGLAVGADRAVYACNGGVPEAPESNVVVFSPAAEDETPPVRRIEGLSHARDLAVDRDGTLFVTSEEGLLEFAPLADGAVEPIGILSDEGWAIALFRGN